MKWFVVSLLIALLATTGCAKSGVSVKATSDNRDIFQNPEGEQPGISMSGEDRASYSARPPFVSLSHYDWEYLEWLDELSAAVARLRLPGSKDVFVEVRLLPDGSRPVASVQCGSIAALDCELLHNQVEDLGELPKLPKGYPHADLVVRLSRLP